MEITIIEDKKLGSDCYYIVAIAGKKRAEFVYSYQTGSITICCCNAAHAVWKGLGKTFYSWADAVKWYKSREMQALVEMFRTRICGPAAI